MSDASAKPATTTAGTGDELAELARVAEIRRALATAIAARVVGQDAVVAALLTALVARGHALLIGPPGVAKTTLVHSVADALNWSFRRIQFTPDLMPSDITGTEVLRQDPLTGARELAFVPGPVFANLVLADEINRATPKTQAALLEAMQERTVSAGGRTHPLPRPFFVLATQNPVEQEGTYRLPEAQLDRFLLAINVGYPSAAEERAIAMLDTDQAKPIIPVLDIPAYLALAALAARLPVPPVAIDYAVRLVRASRPVADAAPWVKESIAWGAGPRATQHLVAAARAHATLLGLPAAGIAEIVAVAPMVLGHRLVPTFQAAGKGLTGNQLAAQLIKSVKT